MAISKYFTLISAALNGAMQEMNTNYASGVRLLFAEDAPAEETLKFLGEELGRGAGIMGAAIGVTLPSGELRESVIRGTVEDFEATLRGSIHRTDVQLATFQKQGATTQ
jgi:hypothetical protein